MYKEYINNNFPMSIETVSPSMSTIGNRHKTISISDVTISRGFKISKISSKEPNYSAIAVALANESCRRQVIKFLDSEDRTANVMRKVILSHNGQARIGSPISDFYIISNAVAEEYKDILSETNAVSVASMLIHKALMKWKMIAAERVVVKFKKLDIDISSADSFMADVVKEEIERHLRDLDFPAIADGISNTNILANTFHDGIRNLSLQLKHATRVTNAYRCVLARLKAYLLDDIDALYTEDEKLFVKNPEFISMSRNLTLINLALQYTSSKPNTHVSFWEAHDSLVYSTINSRNEGFETLKISDLIRRFSSSRLISRDGVLLGSCYMKNLGFKSTDFRIFMQSSGKDYARFVETDESQTVKRTIEVLSRVDNSFIWANLNDMLKTTVSKDDLFFVNFGLTSEDLHYLAVGLSDKVMLNKTTQEFLYIVELSADASNLRLSSVLANHIVTSDPMLILLAKSVDYISKDIYEVGSSFEISDREAYFGIKPLLSDDITQDKELSFCYGLEGDVIKKISHNTSLAKSLGLEIHSNILHSKAIDSMPTLYLWIQLIGFFHKNIDKIVDKPEQEFYKRTRDSKIARWVNDLYKKVRDDDFFKSMCFNERYKAISMLKTDGITDFSSLTSNLVIKELLARCSLVNFLLMVGLISTEDADRLYEFMAYYVKNLEI